MQLSQFTLWACLCILSFQRSFKYYSIYKTSKHFANVSLKSANGNNKFLTACLGEGKVHIIAENKLKNNSN